MDKHKSAAIKAYILAALVAIFCVVFFSGATTDLPAWMAWIPLPAFLVSFGLFYAVFQD